MSNAATGSTDGTQPEPSLTERVRERVLAAHRAQERRDGASQPRIRRRGRPARAPNPSDATDPHAREVQALRTVFREFGAIHRQYLERTGEHTSSGLRAAATAFKQEPSLLSLTAVAGFLDDLELLR